MEYLTNVTIYGIIVPLGGVIVVSKKNDYSRYKGIMIEDGLPISFIGGVVSHLRNLNIKTLRDLFMNYDNGFFNDQRKKFNPELKGTTELLLAYYTGAPLIADNFLFHELNIQTKDDIYGWVDDGKFWNNMSRLGLGSEEKFALEEYLMENYKNINNDEPLTILELIKNFAYFDNYHHGKIASGYNAFFIGSTDYMKVVQNLKFKAKFFEIYLNSKELSKDVVDKETIKKLESQMKSLLQRRYDLDCQLILLQKQLSNIKNDGGIRR